MEFSICNSYQDIPRLFFILEYDKGVGPQGPHGPQEKLQSEGARAPLGPQNLEARAAWGPRLKGPGLSGAPGYKL